MWDTQQTHLACEIWGHFARFLQKNILVFASSPACCQHLLYCLQAYADDRMIFISNYVRDFCKYFIEIAWKVWHVRSLMSGSGGGRFLICMYSIIECIFIWCRLMCWRANVFKCTFYAVLNSVLEKKTLPRVLLCIFVINVIFIS